MLTLASRVINKALENQIFCGQTTYDSQLSYIQHTAFHGRRALAVYCS